jgi:hypothetical protein
VPTRQVNSGDRALQKGFAELDVAQNSVERISVSVIGGACEQCAGRLRPMIGGSDRKVFLAREVMEERPFGDPGGGAQFIHRGSGIALGAD